MTGPLAGAGSQFDSLSVLSDCADVVGWEPVILWRRKYIDLEKALSRPAFFRLGTDRAIH